MLLPACFVSVVVFLVQMVLIRNRFAAYYPSPYVDHHGEQDWGFRRGMPLSLSEARYQQLAAVWARHKVAVEVTKERNTKDSIIRQNWY